jgi:hypothetical protein
MVDRATAEKFNTKLRAPQQRSTVPTRPAPSRAGSRSGGDVFMDLMFGKDRAPKPGESRIDWFGRVTAPANPGGWAADKVGQGLDWFKQPMVAPAAVAAPVLDQMFPTGVSETADNPFAPPRMTATTGAPLLKGADKATAQKYFTGLLGMPVQVNSAGRTAQGNAAAGGVKGSAHTTGEGWDLQASGKAEQDKAVAAKLAAAGFGVIIEPPDTKGGRGHLHVSIKPSEVARGIQIENAGGGFQRIGPSIQPGDTTNSPGVFAVSPAQAMGMLSAPRAMQFAALPDAPAMPMPEDLPQQQLMDKAAMLAPFQALLPQAPDTKNDAWDRVSAMLQGAAGAAAQAGPEDGIGKFLLLAGTGGAAGFRMERKEQEQEAKEYAERLRQTQWTLAQMGFNIDVSNLETENKNLQTAWQSKENKRLTTYNNQIKSWETRVANIQGANEVLNRNIAQMNQFDQTRAQVGLQAAQGVASAANQANSQQLQMNLRAEDQAAGGNQEQQITGLISPYVDLKNTKTPQYAAARQAALGRLNRDPTTALSGVAMELVATGKYSDYVGDATAKAVKTAIDQKNPDAAVAAVQTALNQYWTTSKDTQAQLKKALGEMSADGLTSAKIITGGMAAK